MARSTQNAGGGCRSWYTMSDAVRSEMRNVSVMMMYDVFLVYFMGLGVYFWV